MVLFKESDNEVDTKGVKTILGEPRRALNTMAPQLIISVMLTSIYTLVDTGWIGGLGIYALAGTGLITPLILVLSGLGNGLGSGATATISRYIGEDNKEKANNAAIHVILITITISIIVSVILLLIEYLLIQFLSSANLDLGSSITYAKNYGTIIFAGSILFILPYILYSILRAEGDVTRTMYVMLISGLINIVLDPIFIYILNLGVAGAAYSTLLSSVFVVITLCYWFYSKKNTYLKPKISNFKFDKQIIYDIFTVGIPASLEIFITSIFLLLLSALLYLVSDVDAITVYMTGWKIVSIATMPIIGISMAIISIAGANLGAKKYKNIRIIHRYSIVLSLISAIIAGVIVYIFAPQIITIFTFNKQNIYLSNRMIDFIRCMTLFFVFTSIGTPSTFLFEGLGKGLVSLFQTFLRQIFFTMIFATIFAVFFKLGEFGVWWGIIIGEFVACIVILLWSNRYVNNLITSK